MDRGKLLHRVNFKILEYAANDDRLDRIFCEIAALVTSSVEAMRRAIASQNQDYLEAVCDEEADNIEDAIGVAFLILQSKIRRVRKPAEHIITGVSILETQGKYKTHPYSLVKIIWEVANFYKHCEEWSSTIWECTEITKKMTNAEQQAVRTKIFVQSLGAAPNSTGNFRTIAENLGINTESYDNFYILLEETQTWARSLLDKAKPAS